MFSWNCNESNSHRYDHDDCNNLTATASINVYFHKSRIMMENLQDRSRGSKHNNRPKGFQMSKIRLTTRSGRWHLLRGNPEIFSISSSVHEYNDKLTNLFFTRSYRFERSDTNDAQNWMTKKNIASYNVATKMWRGHTIG